MIPRSAKILPAIVFSLLLGACGGGNSDPGPSTGTTTGSQMRPTVFTSEGRILNSCSLIPACSGIPTAPYFSYLGMAPADGATVSGVVRLEVYGNEMANVELLPANGYAPKLGIFNITGDTTRAWLDLDTTKLPNGPVTVRISAFDVPAGQAGATELVPMTTRTWNINNTAPAAGAFTATLTTAPADGATLSGTTRLELHGSGIVNAELLPATGYEPKLGVFNVSADRTMAWLDLDTRSLGDGPRDVRISAYNATPGQPNATEIVVMPPRHWNFSNGAPFTASVTMAPLHGELLSGFVLFEVRGEGIRNVELLPADGYTPKLTTFSISGDGKFAWAVLDTSTLPNGPLSARISAFNVPAGQANATEMIAMPVRQWNLEH